jgi:hypothetical protein
VRPDGFGIVLQDSMGTLLVGRDQYADRLERYLLARDRLAKNLEIDLRFQDRVTVRVQEIATDEDGAGAEDGNAGPKVEDGEADTARGREKDDSKPRNNRAGTGRKPATKERA